MQPNNQTKPLTLISAIFLYPEQIKPNQTKPTKTSNFFFIPTPLILSNANQTKPYLEKLIINAKSL